MNYFAIMTAADKEMTHSAMLRFLLHNVPQVLNLFAPFSRHEGKLQVSLEVSCRSGKNRRERFDLVACSGGRQLIIENKFKSFPTLAQLARYDAALRKAKSDFPDPVKFLLCFDDVAVSGQGNSSLAVTNGASPWHVLSYAHIRDAVSDWLANDGQSAPKTIQNFCEHYVAYLAAHYKTFTAVREDYNIALCTREEQASCQNALDQKGELTADDVAAVALDPNFWQTLVLHLASLKLEKQLIDKFGQAAEVASRKEQLIIHSKGGSLTPCMNILPPDWPGVGESNMPTVCIQVQGRDMKLYIDGLNEANKKRCAALAYARKLRSSFEDNGGVSEAVMQSHAKRSNSFSVYKDSSCLSANAGNGRKIDSQDLASIIWQFYERADRAVKIAGPMVE